MSVTPDSGRRLTPTFESGSCPEFAGATGYQRRGYDVGLRFLPGTVDSCEQSFCRDLSDFFRVLGDDRDSGFHQVREGEVIESDEGDRVVEAGVAQGPGRTDRGGAVTGENRRRSRAGSQQCCDGVPSLRIIQVLENAYIGGSDTRPAEFLHKSPASLTGGLNLRAIAGAAVGDTAVPVVEEVTSSLGRAGEIVRDHCIRAHSSRGPVNEHQRGAPRRVCGKA